jgi:iron complex outermembrane receptor protein
MVIGSRLLRSGCASLALAAALLAAPAGAQSTQPDEAPQTDAEGNPAEGEAIVVTGSRIRRNPLDLDAPVTFVDQEDIAKTGLNSITDVLQRLPSSGGGLNSRFNNSGNLGNPPDGGGVGAGAAEIDLRYLSSRRVLVLVDGMRYVLGASASGVPGSTDLNSIPEGAIERVEVLQDGASAIYGSDAIAGVVNIITRRSQDGLIGSVQMGGYEQGDGFTQNYQLSWGNGTTAAADRGRRQLCRPGSGPSGTAICRASPSPIPMPAGHLFQLHARTGASPASLSWAETRL